MPTYGLTPTGLVIKTVDVIRAELETQLRNHFGISIKLGDESIFGQLVGIVAERYAVLWELVETLNSASNPDTATGSGLEALSLLTGTLRPTATYSAVLLTMSGTNATVIPADSEIRTVSTNLSFRTTDDVALATADAWVTATVYVVDDFVTQDGNVYKCTIAGTSGLTGPANAVAAPGTEIDPADISDGTVHWALVGTGTAVGEVLARATLTGPVTAVARDLTNIVNAISGWDAVINLTDANEGRNIGTDPELRRLRGQELASGGSSPIDALRAEILDVADVVAATIFVNKTDFTDADGLPPHSIEALVRGPETPTAEFDQSIFDTLLAGVAAGIQTYASPTGNPVTGTATDSEGTVHTMKFSRPQNVNIYVDIQLIVDSTYPSDGDAQVKQQIVQWGDTQNTGKDAVSSRIAATAFNVPGVLDVVHCYIDDAPTPVSAATIAITLRQLAVYDTTRIDVTTTTGVP